MKFAKQFKAAHSISTPLVTVRTFDAKSTVDHIRTIVTDNIGIIMWDCVTGLTSRNDNGKKKLAAAFQSAGTNAELTLQLAEALRTVGIIGEDVLVFISNAHLFWAEPTAMQGIWNLRDSFKSWGSMLVLLTGSGATLPPELSSDVLVLDEPLPTVEELTTIITDTFEYAKLPKPTEDIIDNAVKALVGLPAFPAEQSTAMCLDIPTKILDINELWERKRQAINQTRGLSVYTGKDRLENVGGLVNVKQFLVSIMKGKKAPNAIIFMDEIEKAFAGTGSDSSGVKTELTGQILSWMEDKGIKGIMFIGVPGVGKSQLPKTLGNEFGIPFINFNLSAMQDSLVGNSGNFLRNAQATVDAIADGKVLAIATCNNIESLPPELQSRFQLATFFFDAPTAEERAAIWTVYRKEFEIPDKDLTPPAEGWTGREIKGCCEKAYMLGIPLAEAASYVVPVTISNANRIEALRRNSSGKYLAASNPGLYQYQEAGEESTHTEHTGRKMR